MSAMVKIPDEFEEENWDPQGLNSIEKDELESFSADEEEEEDEPIIEEEIDIIEVPDEEELPSAELDVDGLTELEQMERNLLQEESFDFAMVGEEE